MIVPPEQESPSDLEVAHYWQSKCILRLHTHVGGVLALLEVAKRCIQLAASWQIQLAEASPISVRGVQDSSVATA